MKRHFSAIGLLCLSYKLAACSHPAALSSSPTSSGDFHDRSEAAKIVAQARRIVSPDGIERLQRITLGGIDQWISIRSVDRKRPILLFLHGGPGYAAMPLSWYFAHG